MIGVCAVPSQSVEYSNQLKAHYSRLVESTDTVKPQKKSLSMPWREASEIVGNTMRVKKRLEGGG